MARLLSAINRLSSAVKNAPIFELIQPIWCAATSLLPLDLTRSDSTLFINLELTARCNLRCVYCSKSFDAAEAKRVDDFPAEWIDPCMDTLRRRGLWLVSAHGAGESTIRKGWQGICQSILRRGVNLTIVSNLARPLSDEDLSTLAQFKSILVSLDTANPQLFSRIRRGAKLESLISNIDKLLAYSKEIGKRSPEIGFDIVVSDKTISGLEELVRLGLTHGVTMFWFNDLAKGPDSPGDFNVYNSKTLPKLELAEGLLCLRRAVALAKGAGCKVTCHPGLFDSIRDRLGENAFQSALIEKLEGGAGSWGAPAVPKGMTRDCSLPWQTAMLYANGEVRPCCTSEVSVGDLREQTLDKILDGSRMRKFREDLLSGHVEGTVCMHCSMAPPVPINEFRRRMSGRLVLWSFRRHVLNVLGDFF